MINEFVTQDSSIKDYVYSTRFFRKISAYLRIILSHELAWK